MTATAREETVARTVEKAAEPGLGSRLSDRLNPILVKELRQALRGRLFRVMFLATSALCVLAASVYVLSQGADPEELSGGAFFVTVYAFLSIAVHVFVPFLAFTSLGAEWEENTFDLLTLSDLRPGRIVRGKLLSAITQTALYYCAFAPFLVFAFLLRGLDAFTAAFTLFATLASSTALVCVALALSSLSRVRYLRILLLTLLVGPLVSSTMWSIMGASGMVRFRPDFSAPDMQTGVAVFFSACVIIGAYAIAVACARLAHPEEDRTTALRVLTFVGAIGGIVLAYRMVDITGQEEFVPAIGCLSLAFLTILSIFYATEPERLGRRVARAAPRSSILALFAAPFLPGGGLGYLFFLLTAAVIVGGSFFTHASHPLLGVDYPSFVEPLLLMFAGFMAIYLGIPSGLLSPFTKGLKGRITARVAIPVLGFLGGMVPSFVGLAIDHRNLMRGRHVGNPAWVLDEVADGDATTGMYTGFAIVVALVIAINLPRMLRGVFSVLAASAARRAREAEAKKAA